MLRPFLINDFVRGAISGLGVLNLFAGFAELAPVFRPPRPARPRAVILHLVTDRRRLSGAAAAAPDAEARRCLLQQIDYAIDAAIDVVQIRERDLEGRELAALVLEAVARSRGTNTRIVVNDRVDVAIACGAAGVHLRSDSMAAAAVRQIAPAGFLIGRIGPQRRRGGGDQWRGFI